jgi:hypothetical protein
VMTVIQFHSTVWKQITPGGNEDSRSYGGAKKHNFILMSGLFCGVC